MTVETMRQNLMTLYGKEWRNKVLKMSEAQVIAVHKSMQARGKLKV